MPASRENKNKTKSKHYSVFAPFASKRDCVFVGQINSVVHQNALKVS